MRTRAVIGLVVVALALAATTAFAAEPRTTLPDVEDEVMCLQCGTPLNLSNAPVADRERAFIRREIARGRSKEQIKDAMVDQFGPKVLAVPEDKGFGLAGWIVPVVAALAALILVLLAARRWRIRPVRPVDAEAVEPDDAEAWRLERELSAYDKTGRVAR